MANKYWKKLRCKFCKLYRLKTHVYVSECTNENCEHVGDECIQLDRYESEKCDCFEQFIKEES